MGKSFQNPKPSHGSEKSFPHSSSQWECYHKHRCDLDQAPRAYQRLSASLIAQTSLVMRKHSWARQHSDICL